MPEECHILFEWFLRSDPIKKDVIWKRNFVFCQTTSVNTYLVLDDVTVRRSFHLSFFYNEMIYSYEIVLGLRN